MGERVGRAIVGVGTTVVFVPTVGVDADVGKGVGCVGSNAPAFPFPASSGESSPSGAIVTIDGCVGSNVSAATPTSGELLGDGVGR